MFGDLESEELHDITLINLGNMDNNFLCKSEVLDEEHFFLEIAPILEGSFINEINSYGIILTDRVSKMFDLLYEYSYEEIHV